MTREESKEHIRRYSNGLWGMVKIEYIDKMLDQIFNDHEAELEALQQRSCEECVHRSFIDEALTNKVTNGFCIENGFFTKRDFCCNRYEAKEQ